MNARIFDPVREVPIEKIDMSEYCSVETAAEETGLKESTVWQWVHRSRRVGSMVIGNARFVKKVDVIAEAKRNGRH